MACTVQGSLAWSIVHFVNNPDQRQAVIDDPALIPKAVEEILRIEAAVTAGRRVTRDTELAGVKLSEDDQLIVLLCTANRDPDYFDSPPPSMSSAAPTGICPSAPDHTAVWGPTSAASS